MALVQETGNQFGNGASASISFAGSTVSGNAIVVAVSTYNGAATGLHANAVSDNKGNTYTRVAAHGPVGVNATALFLATNIVGGASHQVTCQPSDDTSQFFTLAIAEFSGIATGAADTSGNATATNTSPTVSLTTTVANCTLIGAFSHDANTGTNRTYTVGGSFTEMHNFGNGGTAPPLLFEYREVTTAGVYAVNCTLDSSVPWMVAAMALAPSGGAATTSGVIQRAGLRQQHLLVR